MPFFYKQSTYSSKNYAIIYSSKCGGDPVKKLLSALCPAIFILPAVINTIVVLWVFVYPWMDQPEQIHIPWQILLPLSLFWISGIVLRTGKWYGGIPGALVPLYAYIESLNGYSGMSHISWLPIVAVTVGYYALCGLLVHWLKNRF